MLNPFELTMFSNRYDIDHNGFKNLKLILSMFYFQNSIAEQYMILKKEKGDHYLICGFDFVNESIIPVQIENVHRILKDLRDFLNSDFNITDVNIDSIDEVVGNFANRKIKKDIDTYKNVSIITTKQRRVITGNSEVYSGGEVISFSKELWIMSKMGFVFGKVNFENTHKYISDIKKIHLFDDVVAKYNIKNNELKIGGSVYNLKKSSNEIAFFLSSFAYELSKKKMGFLSFQSSNPSAPVNAVLRGSGLKKEQINIEGFGEKFVPYLVIIPLENLILDNNKLGMGDVNFLSRDVVEKMYKGFRNNKPIDVFEDFQFFAQTLVESDNAYDAYLSGKKKIQDMLSVVILLSKNDRILNMYNLGTEFNEWDRSRIYQYPECSSLYYVESLLELEYITGDSHDSWGNITLNIDSQYEKNIFELEWFESVLFSQQNGNVSTTHKQLFNALKWLNRSWKTEDIEDKVIYTNIAMEFLVDKIETPPYIAKEIVTEFRKNVKELIEKSEIFSEEDSKKLKEKSLGNLTDPPLRKKVEALINTFEIPITDREFDKLWQVRKYRNSLVHGRDELDIDSDNIVIANILIGEFISFRLRSLKEGE